MINYATGARENFIYAQEKCHFKTIITSKKLLEKLNVQPVEGMTFLEDMVASVKFTEKLPALIKSRLSESYIRGSVHQGDMDETAVILFTSGSEKEPKTVQLSHKNIGHNVDNLPKATEVDHRDIFLANLPLFHVFGLTANFWLPICLGSTIVSYPNPTKGADVVAAITTRDFDKRDLLKQLAAELPAIAVPKEFYVIEDIPIMGTGKVNLREVEKICRKLSVERAAGSSRTRQTSSDMNIAARA